MKPPAPVTSADFFVDMAARPLLLEAQSLAPRTRDGK
jgi:hypothetical protein